MTDADDIAKMMQTPTNDAGEASIEAEVVRFEDDEELQGGELSHYDLNPELDQAMSKAQMMMVTAGT